MNRAEKYDPEDIEYLLSHKSFEELYPEEKDFVLRHMDSESEYRQMRKMILQLTDSPSIDDEWSAPMSMRDDLIAQHEKKHERKTIFIWLNSLFASSGAGITWYKRPGLQLVFASCLIIIIGLTFFNPKSQSDAALSLEPDANSTFKSMEESTNQLLEEQVELLEKDNEPIVNSNGKLDVIEDQVGLIAEGTLQTEKIELEEIVELDHVGNETSANFDFAHENSDIRDKEVYNVTAPDNSTSGVVAGDSYFTTAPTDDLAPAAGSAGWTEVQSDENVHADSKIDTNTFLAYNEAEKKAHEKKFSQVSTSPDDDLIDILYTCW